MKRDMELVRKVLAATEEHAKGTGWVKLEIEGHSAEEVSYHVKLLTEARMLTAENLTSHAGFCWMPKSLTWAGHEFLDAVRNETVWSKTKAVIKDKGGSVPFEVIKAIAIKVVASHFGVG
jgi:Hypothetical protein (DUF2513)